MQPEHPRASLQQTIVRYVLILVICIGGLTVWGVYVKHRHTNTNSSLNSQNAAAQNPFEAVTLGVPPTIANVPIVDENGTPLSLAALRGRVVVLADTMTSCQEECPITTGALITVYNSLAAQHLLDKVTVLELSVDPGRDTPARLAAYSKMTGVQFNLATGTAANLSKIWHYFGVSYWKVKEGTPPDIDWYTRKPYTYDIDHSDDVFVLGPNGEMRYFVDGNADVQGKLSSSLTNLLDDQGHQILAKPGANSWTPSDLLASISRLVGVNIPVVTGTN